MGATVLQLDKPAASRADQAARSVLIGLLCSLAAFICMHGAAGSVADPDAGWHLRTAEWILQHRALPHVDPFSRTTGGSPWQAYSWLFELILLKAYGWMHLRGLLVFTAAMMTLISAALYRMMSRLQSDFMSCAVLNLIVIFCLSGLMTPRPWLFTILFFVIELDILMHARREGTTRELWLLLPLFALWANIHIQFVDGLLVLGLAAIEPLVERWWKSNVRGVGARPLWLALGGSLLAVCVNPYGFAIYKIAWSLGSQSGVLNTVSEMGAMKFRSPQDFLLLFLALAAAGVLFRYRRLNPFETMLLAMAAVLSFRSSRDLWIIVIAASAILAAGLPVRASRETHEKRPLWAPAFAVLTGAAAFAASVFFVQTDNAALQKRLAERMPVQAVQFVKDHHYNGALFNTYDWGGYLIWNLREPVSIDGRAALYGDQAISRSAATWGGGPQWAADPDLASAGVVIGPAGAALTQLLRNDARFTLAYEDKVAAVFVAREKSKAAGQASPNGSPVAHEQQNPLPR
ncbi:MAG TPA: hypothetical protein VHE33_07045 [Acidobacteriaceae bacterium]|nr:hypothetical protein [Acidobacteriaceae bacterium]